MAEAKVTVVNKMGLHARPAAQLVKTAAGFKSDVLIKRDDQVVNGKSIMGVMMLAAGMGTELTIMVTGKDEDEALEAIAKLFESKFSED
jgi:phosphocarrier protein